MMCDYLLIQCYAARQSSFYLYLYLRLNALVGILSRDSSINFIHNKLLFYVKHSCDILIISIPIPYSKINHTSTWDDPKGEWKDFSSTNRLPSTKFNIDSLLPFHHFLRIFITGFIFAITFCHGARVKHSCKIFCMQTLWFYADKKIDIFFIGRLATISSQYLKFCSILIRWM